MRKWEHALRVDCTRSEAISLSRKFKLVGHIFLSFERYAKVWCEPLHRFATVCVQIASRSRERSDNFVPKISWCDVLYRGSCRGKCRARVKLSVMWRKRCVWRNTFGCHCFLGCSITCLPVLPHVAQWVCGVSDLSKMVCSFCIAYYIEKFVILLSSEVCAIKTRTFMWTFKRKREPCLYYYIYKRGCLFYHFVQRSFSINFSFCNAPLYILRRVFYLQNNLQYYFHATISKSHNFICNNICKLMLYYKSLSQGWRYTYIYTHGILSGNRVELIVHSSKNTPFSVTRTFPWTKNRFFISFIHVTMEMKIFLV